MATPAMSKERAERIFSAIEEAFMDGHRAPGSREKQCGLGAIRVGIMSLGYSRGAVSSAYTRAVQIMGREVDWDALAIERDATRRAALRGEIGAPPIPRNAEPPPGFVVTHNGATYDGGGNLKSQSIKTRRDAGEKYEPLAGQSVCAESALLDPDGRILARWVKTGRDGGNLIEALRDTFAEYRGHNVPAPLPDVADDDLLTFYPLPDLHIGLHAWGRETGESYDTDIAVDEARRAVASLVATSRPSKRAVILGLGDYFHSNDAKAVTPGSGHKLDVDGRWQRVYAAGARLATSIIEIVSSKHPQVDVAFLPGNHDPDAAATLTVAMALFYDRNPAVHVCETPGSLWFYRFGKVLLGATHGDKMKPVRMAQVMAHDRAEDWGHTTHRHFFFGHVHHVTSEEVPGVIVESFSAPVAKDAYTTAAGYRARRRLTAITFHREYGEQARHHCHLPLPRVRVKVKAA